ncbi:hypothetical protein HF086_005399 [Spodoptera exigua]|uniref:Uncharacterized protein n=1 Tax=Spodoptera exigua TaxID=7107 RepID=A0A922S924_SPOEX|nr:hypothetical protein HF086_005399 [Spodoptera exigua]
MNGLVSLVHQTGMGEISQAAMDAILALHRPDRRQICNYREVLRWLRDILTCRNEFLAKHKEYANVGSQIPISKQAHIKLEVVFFMCLWSIDTDVVLVAMSCFALLCQEADIRDSLCKLLQKYPKGQGDKVDDCQMEAIHRAVAKRRVSHHTSSEHDFETHVKELVGHEMSPALYPILFDQIKAIIDKFFDQQQQVMLTDINTQFVEHTIFIMKSILDIKKSGQPNEHLSTTSIETLMLSIVRYVRHLDMTVLSVHIKTKLCQVVEAMMRRRDDLAFRQIPGLLQRAGPGLHGGSSLAAEGAPSAA